VALRFTAGQIAQPAPDGIRHPSRNTTNMKAQHTPGPWTQGRVGETQCFDLIGPNVTGRGQEVVGTLRALQSTTIDAANAALIASAPDLLAALEGAAQALARALPFLPADTEAHFAGEWLGEVREVIRQAKGDQ